MKRSAWQITRSVWHALLLREAVARLFRRRAAAVWLLLEPVASIGFMMVMFTALRARHVGGMDSALWLSAGLLGFYLFRRTSTQGAAAISANLALFTYRQVKPVDTVLTRCLLEGVILMVISSLVAGLLMLTNHPLKADDPLSLLWASLGLWLLGLAWALVTSVLTMLVPEMTHLLGLLMMPLMLVSGAVFPLSAIPYPWREWLMLNPVAHGIEGVRAALSGYYHHAPELSLAYLHGVAMVLLLTGLALQIRFHHRVVSL